MKLIEIIVDRESGVNSAPAVGSPASKDSCLWPTNISEEKSERDDSAAGGSLNRDEGVSTGLREIL